MGRIRRYAYGAVYRLCTNSHLRELRADTLVLKALNLQVQTLTDREMAVVDDRLDALNNEIGRRGLV